MKECSFSLYHVPRIPYRHAYYQPHLQGHNMFFTHVHVHCLLPNLTLFVTLCLQESV